MRTALAAIVLGLSVAACGQADVSVGSKSFTESVILGEVATQLDEEIHCGVAECDCSVTPCYCRDDADVWGRRP